MLGSLFLPFFMLTQVLDSTYDHRALRLNYGPGSTWIVQGAQAWSAGGGFFLPGSIVLESARDSVRREYESSRAGFKRYAVLGGLSMASAIATMAYYGKRGRDWQPGWGIGLPVATIAFGWLGQASASRGEDHLRRAIWRYNRDFPRTFVFDSTCSYDECAVRVRPGVLSKRLVRGVHEAPIGRLDAQSDLFAAAGDSARVHYEAFRSISRSNRSARRVALVSYLGAGVLYAASNRKLARDVALGLMIVGYAAGHSTVYGQASADSELDAAIWFYNRTLR